MNTQITYLIPSSERKYIYQRAKLEMCDLKVGGKGPFTTEKLRLYYKTRKNIGEKQNNLCKLKQIDN